jgi:hypothetical protein
VPALELHIDQAELQARDATGHVLTPDEWVGMGRELFASMRAAVGPADQGASVFAPRSRHESAFHEQPLDGAYEIVQDDAGNDPHPGCQ